MKEENTDAMLWHAETPHLVILAEKAMQLRLAIYRNSGILWKSKQWRPKSKPPVEVVLGTALAFARRRLESSQDAPHAIVRRGDFPINDAIMDDFLEVLRKEASDMFAYYQGTSKSSTGTASASGGESEVTAAASNASIEGGRSSVELISVAASSKGLFKWQVDKLMEWMLNNNYNPSPDWDAIDELVESTRMKPSQVVAWVREVGDSITKLRSTGTRTVEKQHEVITIDDDEDDDDQGSVPGLTDEENGDDSWNVHVTDEETELSARMSLSMPLSRNESKSEVSEAEVEVDVVTGVEAGTEFGVDIDLDDSSFDLGFEFGDSNSFDGTQAHEEEEAASATCGCSTDDIDDLLQDDFLHLDDDDFDSDDEEILQRPSKRARSD